MSLVSHHHEHDISDEAGLAHLAASLRAAPSVGVDLETNSMYVYRARLCFVQLSTEDEIFIVDTLDDRLDARALNEPFLDASRRKIFHDAQGDLRVLAGSGIRVVNLFDTQRAAMFLGLPKIGLGDLVEERFGIRLAKEHQTANFGERPLPPDLRTYVANDVRYLLPLAEQLEAEAKEKGIHEELQLEFQRLTEEGCEPETPPRPKLANGARDPLGLAIAAAADRLRHREAEARDIPVGRVLANAAVGEIALHRPTTMKDLARLQGVKTSFTRPAGEELLAEITRLAGLAMTGGLPPAPKPPDAKRDPTRRAREEKIRAWRSEAAKARGVVPSVILPTPVIERLVSQPPNDLDDLAQIPWLGEKRLRMYGQALLSVLG